MPTNRPATVMGSFDLVEAFTPANRQKSSFRISLFGRSISDWKRLDILLAIREYKMQVFAKLFIAADADSTPPRTLASRKHLHLENQLASRFRHFWID
jgi:hypothetical protein